MARVLLVGYDPDTVDYSDPALPRGMTPDKIGAGLSLALKQMTERGWEADLCLIRPDETAEKTVERHLASSDGPLARHCPRVRSVWCSLSEPRRRHRQVGREQAW
jgi:hypothetical protein